VVAGAVAELVVVVELVAASLSDDRPHLDHR
jgi:hypothetical protein